MIKCRLWLRCCNKIISSYSRQTMEALTNMWIHATNKGSPLAVMMVRFYIFKHFMNSVFVDCRGFWIAGILKVSLSPHSYNVGIEGLECPKIKNINFDLTGSCTATATNPSTGECNESICPSGYCKFNIHSFDSRFNYYNQSFQRILMQASVSQAALLVTRLMSVTGNLIFLSLLLGQMIIYFFPFLFINNNLLLLGLGNTMKQSAACWALPYEWSRTLPTLTSALLCVPAPRMPPTPPGATLTTIACESPFTSRTFPHYMSRSPIRFKELSKNFSF